MNIAEIFSARARERPDAAALVDGPAAHPRTTSFRELEEASARGAARLSSQGVRAGDPVLIFHPMSRELYVVLLAVFRLRAVAMFLDPSAGRSRLEACCDLQPPRAFVGGPKAHLLRLWSGKLWRIPRAFCLGGWAARLVPWSQVWSDADRVAADLTIPETAPSDPALLTFTSGSTGKPKAVVRSHGFLAAQHARLAETLELKAGEVDLATLPIFVLANLGSGVTNLIPPVDLRRPGAIDPHPVLDWIARFRPVSMTAAPAFMERIVRSGKEKLDSLERIYTGGGPVFPGLLDRLQEAAPQAVVTAVYGSSEAEPIADLRRDEIATGDRAAMAAGRGLLAGRPIDKIQLRVIRERWGESLGPWSRAEFEAQAAPAGEPGEIVVHGDHVLQGYLHGEGDAETKFRVDGDVWHRTGDAGRLDETGRLWLLGRCSARIVDGRGRIFPFAVETAAQEDQSVHRAALLGWEGRRILFVEPAAAAAPPDLAALRARLAWAELDEVLILPRIPVDDRHNSKIDYTVLSALARRCN